MVKNNDGKRGEAERAPRAFNQETSWFNAALPTQLAVE
jgi:hypothetical protein